MYGIGLIGSIFTNSIVHFIREHSYLFGAFAAIFIFTAALVFLVVSKAKRVEAELLYKKKEINNIYQELAASNGRVCSQLEKLMTSQEQLYLSEQKYKLAVESANDIIWDWDLITDERRFSDKLYAIIGHVNTEITTSGQWDQYIHSEDLQRVTDTIKDHLEGKTSSYFAEYRVKCSDGTYRWLLAKGRAMFDKNAKPYRMIGAYTDITQYKANEERIKQMAYYDHLTGLPNRAYLGEYISTELMAAPGDQLAFLYIDVDNFKLLNDTYGHSKGDQLLFELGQRISRLETHSSKAFRIGGDEFAIAIRNVGGKDQVEGFVLGLMEKLADPIPLEDMTLHTSISVGIVVYPQDGITFEELLKNADLAMYNVKEKGKRGYGFFDWKMNETVVEKMSLEKSMRKALENNEFTLHYQPQTSAITGEILGFEALIRWFSPELGTVPPNRFIRVAEETGLIIPIGEWVLRTACSFASQLQTAYGDKRFVSINLSTLQLRQNNFVSKVIEIIRDTGVDPSCIELEITETILMDSFEDNINKLNELKEYGIKISLDDFGTGYSSLTYLRRLPINTLKIDKSFVDDILSDDDNKRIINSVIQLAHSIGLRVVAEGVEQKEQYEYLKNSSCDLIQGYYISKPVAGAEVIKMVM